MQRSSASSVRSGSSFLALSLLAAHFAADAADCVRLRRVDVDESRILSARERTALVRPFLDACIDGDLLRALLTRFSDHYIERGYVTTRPYLPEQDVGDGRVEVRVIVGRIEKVIDAASGSGNARLATAFLFTGDILNLRDLETALEVIQRPPSVTASFEIRPGSGQGDSLVAVETIERKPYRLEFGVNAQTELDNQLSFRASLDNALGINDILEFRHNSGDVRETLQSNRSSELFYSFPLGSFLLELGRSEIEYEQRIQGFNGSFVASGEADTNRLRIGKLVARDRHHRLELAAALEIRDSRNFFEDEPIDVSTYKTSQLRLELRHDWLQSWGQVGTAYVYHRGLDSYGARDDDYYAPEAGFDTEARLQFEKLTIDSRLVHFLAPPAWQLNLSLFLQYSDDILYPNDRVNLGSPYTVRGYSSALNGSNAWYLRGDLVRLFRGPSDSFGGRPSAKSIALSFGIDYGEVRCESDNPDTCGTIYGAGPGVEIIDANFQARLSWARPLKRIGDDIGDRDRLLVDLRWLF